MGASRLGHHSFKKWKKFWRGSFWSLPLGAPFSTILGLHLIRKRRRFQEYWIVLSKQDIVLFSTISRAVLPEPDPASIQSFLTNPSPPAKIPAFPKQSDIARCPLQLFDDLFSGIQNACGTSNGKNTQERPSRSRCCPVLATWLYSAYSGMALDRIGRTSAESYDLPVLLDDSETCVDNLEKALKGKGLSWLGRTRLAIWFTIIVGLDCVLGAVRRHFRFRKRGNCLEMKMWRVLKEIASKIRTSKSVFRAFLVVLSAWTDSIR